MSPDERADVTCDDLCLTPSGAGHLVIGGGYVAEGENPFLARHLQVRRDLDEAVRAPGIGEVAGEIVTDRGDPVAAEPDVRGHTDAGLGDDGESLMLAGGSAGPPAAGCRAAVRRRCH